MATNNKISTPTQKKVIPGVTATTAMFATSTPVRSALIIPLPGNTATTGIAFDWDPTSPLNMGALELSRIPDGSWYDLSQLNVKAGNTTDGLLVIYFTE